MAKSDRQELIVKPTLEERVRFGNRGAYEEPMLYGGFEDNSGMMPSYSGQIAGAMALGLMDAASRVHHDRRTFLKVLGLGSAAAGLEACSIPLVAASKRYESTNFVFYLPEDLSKQAVDYIMEEHELGLKKLEERLGLERNFGRKLGGKLTLSIGSGEPDRAWLYGSKAGTTTLSRGFVGAGTIRSDRSPYVHELTHQFTGKAGDFFSEGLAEYMQTELGRNPAPVTWGADLHRKIAGTELAPLSKYMGLTALNRELGNEAATAYLQAGSFVKYLIEDVAKGNTLEDKTRVFMEFYLVHGDYKRAFGKTFEQLEEAWREKIKNTKPLYALSDALKVEHLNPRLKPTGKLDTLRQRIIKPWPTANTVPPGGFYPIWVDVNLESNTDDTIEIVKYEINNEYKGQRIGSSNDYNLWVNPSRLKLILSVLGRRVEPNKPRLVPDFPIPVVSAWNGTEFVVHYTYKIPKISGDEFDAPVRMKVI